MRYRVDELAVRSGVSVDTIRFYQTKGLLVAPEREGRAAWYSDDHLERLIRVRDLKSKGFTLTSIRRLLDGELDKADEALIAAVADAVPTASDSSADEEEFFTIEQLADRIGVSAALLQAIEREGLLVPRRSDSESVYTSADAAAAKAGLALLETGLPLSDLLSLAHDHDKASRLTAERAVEMFDRFVRGPIREGAESDDEAAEKLVEAFRKMLPATVTLVAHHFRRVLLATAQARIEKVGVAPEIEAVRNEASRRLEPTWPA
ncbi:MAG: MerR family transcriptional regulator [Actinomycetota bacterium]|nr:MerR family transcriptional regulator [Actinomycetota bacterium]